MTWITDNPIPLFILGLIAQLTLGVILWQTGRGRIVFLMIAFGICSIALLAAEMFIVSPAEEIANTLDAIAVALVTNEPEKVLAFIAPEKTAQRDDAAQQLKRVRIEEAAVTGDLRISFDASPKPDKQTANASFIARIKAKLVRGTSPHEQAVLRFKLYFRKENGKWLVTKYEMNRR